MVLQISFPGAASRTIPVILVGVIVCLYIIYRRLLPKPIPGIPYNREAVKSILGDAPSLVRYNAKTKEIFTWLLSNLHAHNSPIVQVFPEPTKKPWVIICDAREAEDIFTRRSHEFEKPTKQIVVFGTLIPKHHISMQTNDEFKQHRQLIQGLMTPNFLQQITTPQVHERFSGLIQVWEQKARLAQGHPFAAKEDIYNAGMDTIWAAAFGLDSPVNATMPQVKLLTSLSSIDVPANMDTPIEIPVAPRARQFTAIMELVDTLEVPLKSPMPKLAHWFVRQTRKYKENDAVRENMIKSEVEKRAVLLNGKEKKDFAVRCGLDDVLRRELIAAERHGRKPDFHTRTIYDEVFGYVVAGSETTSTALCWSVKFFAQYPDVQIKLRAALRDAFPSALAEQRVPSAPEITKTTIPYLDATQEELLRHSRTGTASARRTTRELDILGHTIPKGVDVWMMGNGPSYFEPAFDIPDSMRSASSLAAKSKTGSWDPADIGAFKPERWLVTDEKGQTSFNPSAGPHLTFSLGPRACWGRKMAYLEMRIVLVLIIWNFELLGVGEELAGMEAVDKVTHQPQNVYVRLRKVDH